MQRLYFEALSQIEMLDGCTQGVVLYDFLPIVAESSCSTMSLVWEGGSVVSRMESQNITLSSWKLNLTWIT